MTHIPINLAVEDSLSEAVLKKILNQSGCSYAVGLTYMKNGYGYLKSKINGFNNAAKGTPFLVLTDLDTAQCPAELIRKWLPNGKNHNLLFRIAVREVEAWILAHRIAFAEFLCVSKRLIPSDVDNIVNPKQLLINLAKKSPRCNIRQGIVPKTGSLSKQGPDYNGQLNLFVEHYWNVLEAKNNSYSLRRTFDTVTRFKPEFCKSQK